MLIADLTHSCSNAHVARAAVACVGGEFADRVAAAAEKKGVDVGRFVAAVVRNFARRANRDALRALGRSVENADQPLLLGLVHVVAPALEDDALFFDDEDLCPTPGPAASWVAQYGYAGLH
ncbi:MAG TPA: hypothetical protein VEH76_08725 [Methylocystis sp.]|nr:hypothetical protein [Methylocystis sp.]